MNAVLECGDEVVLVCADCGRVIGEYVPPAALNEVWMDAIDHREECDGDGET